MKRTVALLLMVCVVLCTTLAGCREKIEFDTSPTSILEPAMLAYHLFVRYTLSYDENTARQIGDTTYYLVTDERFPTYPAFDEYVGGYFSDQIKKTLFDKGAFVNVDGRLYTTEHTVDEEAFLGNITQVSYLIDSQKSKKIVYRALVAYRGDTPNSLKTDNYYFTYQKVDERWVFTEFPYFWSDQP